MIKKTICQDCQTPNTPGSKFCSNCGARLPKSTSIMCPRCQTPNPSSNFYCDKCGSRLSQEAAPTRPVEPGSLHEDLPTSAKMFSLPTRKPGETGELTADNVMDWLMSGQTGSGETPPDTGKLPRLSALTPERRETGDLPDWLFDSDSPEPLIDAPPDITTAHFLNLIKQIDDDERKKLSGMLSEQVGDTGSLPDWLQEFVQPTEPGAPPDTSKSEEPKADTDDLDWLARLEVAGGAPTPSPTGPPAAEPDDFDELPDWLDELSPPKTSLLGKSSATWKEEETLAATPEPDFAASLDWLEKPITGDLDPDEAADEVEEALPDWLFGEKPDTDSLARPLAEESTPAAAEYPGWLVDPIGGSADEAPPFEPEGALDAAEKSLTAWLSDFDEEAEEEAEPAPPEDVAEKSLTAWLTSFEEAEEEAEPAPSEDVTKKSLTAWLTDFEEAAEEEEEIEPAPVESVAKKSLTDWLTSFDEAEEAASAPVEGGTESSLTNLLAGLSDDDEEAETSTVSEVTEKSLTDWLTDFADDEAEAVEGPLTEGRPLADWLDDELVEDAPEETTAVASADDWFQPDPTAELEEEAADDFADWFSAGETTDEADKEMLAVGMTGPLPDWLDDLDLDKPEITQEEQAEVTSFLDDLLGIQELAPTAVTPSPTPEEADLADADAFAFDFAEEDEAEAASMAEEPDWLSELATFDPDAMIVAETEDAAKTTAVAPVSHPPDKTEELSEEEEDAEAAFLAMMSATSEEDWDPVDDILAGKIDSEEFPDWLTQLESSITDDLLAREDKPVTGDLDDEIITGELPEWIVNLRPDETAPAERLPTVLPREEEQDLYAIPADLVSAELPEWLQEADISPVGLVGLTAEREEQADWGEGGPAEPSDELAALLADLPDAPPEAELLEAEIPDWVLSLKPPELSGMAVPVADMPAETTGPLAGLPGVVRVEPIVVMPRAVMPPAAYAVTDEQTQQALLLRQLVREMESPPPAAPPRLIAGGQNWLRRGVALLLLATAVFALLLSGSLFGSQPAPTSPAVIASHDAIEAAAGRPVLVAFDYTPALAGELDHMARLLLAELQDNGSLILTTSQYAAGTAVANTLAAPYNSQSIGLLAGEAIGLRQLANCLNDSQTACSTLQGRTLNANVQSALQEVALVILLTGERASLVDWVEQVGVAADAPIVVGVTQALSPVAAPYAASGQLIGVLDGLPAVIAYADAYGASVDLSQARAQHDAQGLLQLLAAFALLIGALAIGLTRPKAPARGK